MTEKNASRGPSPERRNPSRASSPSTAARPSSAEVEAYALPIRKTNPLIYAGAAVVALGIVGALVLSGAGESSSNPDPEAKLSADAPHTLTKEEQKERLEHLRKTQAALEAAALEEKASEKAVPAAASAAPAPAHEPTPAPAKAAASKEASAAKPEEPKKKVSDAQSKKKAADLDALGADITSALQ